MKTKAAFTGLFITIFFCCTGPSYLPQVTTIDINPYGAQITVDCATLPRLKGELIACDDSSLVVLSDINYLKRITPEIIVIPAREIKHFKLKYARSKSYWWTLPVFTAVSASHGIYAVYSAPVNLLITALIALSATVDFQYDDKDISYNELKMFARFPQGIPPNIDVALIK